ncbi:alpha/beta fold hydrolase [Dyadobacter subterraneus]|uniref:Alpha/beta hydrolase n=1 Tax=Dyadobacter subterraneus TaxID=2773304 RepID=A0ABR9WCS5_9BACT|nr:alpha/beta hydrolase [Dyadobacter subterraneus]MBE9463265.1 alpha/beta hydrolase [Dyadobacter subterraneus]
MSNKKTSYKYLQVGGLKIFYREAGDPLKETIVLLHGFPTSSHMYRRLLLELSDEFHLIAPDYPGFGNSDFPSPDDFQYTFDNISNIIDQFLESLNLTSYVLMIQDYGAPVGYRIATAHPERVRAFIVQNGNAYEEGLSEGFAESRKFWKTRTPETESPMRAMFTLESIRWQYTFGSKNPENISPDNWNLDFAKISRPGNDRAQLDLLYDYKTNLELYPKWQQYLRDNQPPMLITWGKNDPFFPEPGAKAYLQDVENAEYYTFDTGHFALEEEGLAISKKIRDFMRRLKV